MGQFSTGKEDVSVPPSAARLVLLFLRLRPALPMNRRRHHSILRSSFPNLRFLCEQKLNKSWLKFIPLEPILSDTLISPVKGFRNNFRKAVAEKRCPIQECVQLKFGNVCDKKKVSPKAGIAYHLHRLLSHSGGTTAMWLVQGRGIFCCTSRCAT